MDDQTKQQSKGPEFESCRIRCDMKNAFPFPFQYGSSNLDESTKFTSDPVDVPAYDPSKGEVYVDAFSASGRSWELAGCKGDVKYQFQGVYGVVSVNISFYVPVTGENTFTVGLTGPTRGARGDYACTYSNSNGSDMSGSWTITGPGQATGTQE